MGQEIINAAYRVGRVFVSDIYAYYQDTFKGTLGKVQVEALDYLHIRQQVSVTDLARRLNISKQHASKIAAKLEDLGYTAKSPDPADGRGCLYQLTKEGLRFLDEHIALSNQYLETYIHTLNDDERRQLLISLMQAAEILEKCASRRKE